MMRTWITRCGSVLLLLSIHLVALGAEPMVVKHFDAGYSPALRPYFYDVLKLTLDLTEAEFGPYRIVNSQQNLSAARSKLETEKGDILNVLFSPGWGGELGNRNNVVSYPFTAFNDLLGLRSLLVRSASELLLKPPNTREEFVKYAAGLGFYWEDVAILRSAGIDVLEAQVFDALFPMLEKNRFDYVPFSALEVDATLRRKSRQFPEIEVHPSVQIFYPMHFQLYVNTKVPNLAARIGLGLRRAEEGPLEQVFAKHFGGVQFVGERAKRLYIIRNPTLDAATNDRSIARFLEKYGQHYQLMQ